MSFNFVNLLYCLMVCTSWFIAISYTVNLVTVCCCCFILNFLSNSVFSVNRKPQRWNLIEFDRRNLLRVFPCVCLAYHWARFKTLHSTQVCLHYSIQLYNFNKVFGFSLLTLKVLEIKSFNFWF